MYWSCVRWLALREYVHYLIGVGWLAIREFFVTAPELRVFVLMKPLTSRLRCKSALMWLITGGTMRKVWYPSGGSRIFQMGGRCFVANGGAHILFSGKKCMKLKEIGLKWGGARLLAPCYSKITIFLWIILNSIMKTSYFTYLRIFWDILYKIIF